MSSTRARLIILPFTLVLGACPGSGATPGGRTAGEAESSRPGYQDARFGAEGARPAGEERQAAAPGSAPSGPPAKVIYLARHGRTHMNRRSQIGGQIDTDELDVLGYKQRVGLFVLLKDEPIKAVYTSALLRARQTAEPLAAERGITPVASADLNEFRGGVSEGICYSLLGKPPPAAAGESCDVPSGDPLVQRGEAFLKAEEKRRFTVGLGYRWPGGGESLLDVDKRLARFVASVPASLRDETILIVGHSGTNRFLLGKLMGWSMEESMRIRQEHTQVFRVERGGPSQRPVLSVNVEGQWVPCPEPPTQKGGLPCLAPKPRHAP